jgi:molecular chaperone DnaJ
LERVLTMSDDPYRVLGVSPDATDAEIKRTYRKLARQHHPDRNPNDAAAEERFKAIQAAYEQVGSGEKRKKFDEQQRMASMFGGSGGRSGDFSNMEFNFDGGGGGGFEDIVASFFSGGGGRPAPGQGGGTIFDQQGRPRSTGQRKQERGAHIEATLDLSLEEAAGGAKKPFTISRKKRCKPCGGGGCGGCAGAGILGKTSQITVTVPANAEHASVMRLKGMGHEARGGPAGDLLLTVRIDADEGRHWEGGRLVQTVAISYSTMLLGGKIRITTPTGKLVEIEVPPNSQAGDRRRLRGQGYNGGPLDVEFELEDTGELTAEQQAALKSLRDSGL